MDKKPHYQPFLAVIATTTGSRKAYADAMKNRVFACVTARRTLVILATVLIPPIAAIAEESTTNLPAAPLSPIARAEPATLPVLRTLTDSTGRKLEGTILRKTGTTIRFRRSIDGKEFDLPLDKLSADDRTFVADARDASVKKAVSLPNASSIAIQEKVVKSETPMDTHFGKVDSLTSIATSVFVRGKDMTDSPALIRVTRIQQNVDDEDKNAMSETFSDAAIEEVTVSYPVQKSDPVKFLWFAEVWQDGKLVCKSYQTNRMMAKLPPPSRVGSETTRFGSKAKP